MDIRYQPLATYVVNRFAAHLGSRLQSAFVNGSVVRGDAVWGVSDLDLVLAFDRPTAADTALKRAVEQAVLGLPGGEGLVIHRIGDDMLQKMSTGARAYCLYSLRNESHVLLGAAPASFLPGPPPGDELARLLAPIIREDGAAELEKPTLTRQESRHLSKRILHGLTLPAIAAGWRDYVAPLEVAELSFPSRIQAYVPVTIQPSAAYTCRRR